MIKDNKLKIIIKTFIVCALAYAGLGHADMMKCVIKKSPQNITNYFESTDKRQRKKCLTKPVTVVTSSGEKIKKNYQQTASAYSTQKSQVQFEPLTAAKDVKPMGCSGTGGTVKVNGRIFHLDPAALCKKYGARGKGSITAGTKRYGSGFYSRHYFGRISV